METKAETFSEGAEVLQSMLDEFSTEQDLQQKGIQLGGLHAKAKTLKEYIAADSTLMEKRKMQAILNPKLKMLAALEKDFLLDTEIRFYSFQVEDFKTITSPFYILKGNKKETDMCIARYEQVLKGYEELRKIKPASAEQANKIVKVLTMQKNEINKFSHAFQDELKRFYKKNNQGNLEQSSDQFSEGSSENNSEIDQMEGQNGQDVLNQLRAQKLRLEEDMREKQDMIRQEEEEKEKMKEILEIAQEISKVNILMQQVNELILKQGEQLEDIELKTDQTAEQLIGAEKEIDQASIEQSKYRSKLMSIQGAAIGGGVGMFLGGPVGIAVGSVVGGTIAKGISKLVFRTKKLNANESK